MGGDHQQTPAAAVIVIGNEVLSGRTQDANLSYIAEALTAHGIRLAEARVLPDRIETIAEAVNHLRRQVDYLFTTGGIGPTHDDITAAAVAEAFGLNIERNSQAVERLQAHYDAEALNEARLSMADMPAGAELIDNPVSRAPGFRIGNVYVLAGVPRIMQAMLDGLMPRLTGGPPILSRTLSAFLAEGEISAGLREIQDRYPRIDIGSYPYFQRRRFGVSIVLRGQDADALDDAAAAVAGLIRRLGEDPRDADLVDNG